MMGNDWKMCKGNILRCIAISATMVLVTMWQDPI